MQKHDDDAKTRKVCREQLFNATPIQNHFWQLFPSDFPYIEMIFRLVREIVRPSIAIQPKYNGKKITTHYAKWWELKLFGLW